MIRVGFSTQKKNPISKIIRKLTGSTVSHAWLVFDDPVFEREMVIEATETGVVMTPFDVFSVRNDVVEILTPRISLHSGLKTAGQWLGESYDFTGLFGTAIVLLGRWFKRRWKNPFNNAKAMFCSEFVVRVLQESGYPGSECLDPSATTPQDLREFMCRPI